MYFNPWLHLLVPPNSEVSCVLKSFGLLIFSTSLTYPTSLTSSPHFYSIVSPVSFIPVPAKPNRFFFFLSQRSFRHITRSKFLTVMRHIAMSFNFTLENCINIFILLNLHSGFGHFFFFHLLILVSNLTEGFQRSIIVQSLNSDRSEWSLSIRGRSHEMDESSLFDVSSIEWSDRTIWLRGSNLEPETMMYLTFGAERKSKLNLNWMTLTDRSFTLGILQRRLGC